MDFAQQKRILEPILKNPKNSHCADCGAVSPTCTFPFIQGLHWTSEFSFVPTVRVLIAGSAPR